MPSVSTMRGTSRRITVEKDWTPQAHRRVLSALALETIAEDCELEPSADEVEAEMNRALQYYRSIKQAEKDIDLERLHAYSKGRIRNEKVLEYLEGLK